jgi:hypothetical protein
MLRNPIKYPDPEKYRPERFLEPAWPTYEEPLSKFPRIKGMTSFGWGQRNCIGQSLTEDELLMTCGSLVWGFNVKKQIDPITGNEIDIDTNAATPLLIIKPLPFLLSIQPRSEQRRIQMIEQWTAAEAKDQQDKKDFLDAAAAMRK